MKIEMEFCRLQAVIRTYVSAYSRGITSVFLLPRWDEQ